MNFKTQFLQLLTVLVLFNTTSNVNIAYGGWGKPTKSAQVMPEPAAAPVDLSDETEVYDSAPTPKTADTTIVDAISLLDNKTQNEIGQACALPQNNVPVKRKFSFSNLFKRKTSQSCQIATCSYEHILSSLAATTDSLKDKFETLDPAEFNNTRRIIETTDGALAGEKCKIPKAYKTQVKNISEKFDPYGISSSEKNALFKALEILQKPEEIKDVREVALLQDIFENQKFQRKLNTFIHKSVYTPGFEVNPKSYIALEALYKVTNLGRRFKNLSDINESLQKKMENAEKASNKVSIHLSADEAFLIDQKRKINGFLFGNTDSTENVINTKFIKNPRLANLTQQIRYDFKDYSDNSKAIQKLDEILGNHWEPGDIVLEQLENEAKYKGRKLDIHGKIQKLATGVDIHHVGFIINDPTEMKKRSDVMLHLIDGEEGKSGVEFYRGEIGSEIYRSGYRFNFENLASKELLEAAKKDADKKHLTLHDYFVKKNREYGSEYSKNVYNSFEDPENKLVITNDKNRRIKSVFQGLASRFSKRDLRQKIEKDRTPDEKNKTVKKEICSEFAAKQSIEYLTFLEKRFKEDLKLKSEKQFIIPFDEKMKFSGFHPGKLANLMNKLQEKGLVEKIGAPEGVFATRSSK